MPDRPVTASLYRFWAGFGLGLINAYIVFRSRILRPSDPAFECLAASALLAGVLALVRLERTGQALGLAVAYGAYLWLSAPDGRVVAGLSGLLLGLGIVLVAMIYRELSRFGLRLGKFLIIGPLLGGVYLAVAPISEFHELSVFNAVHPMLFRLALGVVIGEGVGLGVELVELLPRRIMGPVIAVTEGDRG